MTSDDDLSTEELNVRLKHVSNLVPLKCFFFDTSYTTCTSKFALVFFLTFFPWNRDAFALKPVRWEQIKTKTSILTNSVRCLKKRKGVHGNDIVNVAKTTIYGFLNHSVFFLFLSKCNLTTLVLILAIWSRFVYGRYFLSAVQLNHSKLPRDWPSICIRV